MNSGAFNVEQYILDHSDLINSAMGIIKGRVPKEEMKDMRQELYLTMIKCTDNYNPLLKNTFDMYVIKSIENKAKGLLYGKAERLKTANKKMKYKRITPKQIDSVSSDNSVFCYYGNESEMLDTKVIVDTLLNKLPITIKNMVFDRASGYTLHELAKKYDTSYETVRTRYNHALAMMRQWAKD